MTKFRLGSNYRYRSHLETNENQTTFHMALDDSRTETPQIFHDYSNPLILHKLMRMIYLSLIHPEDFIPKDLADYHLWYEYELLRRIDESDNLRSKKPDYMEEDLLKIIERRDDLLIKIERQTKHIETNKSKIQDMGRKLSQYWKMHLGPFLSFKDHNLIFESLTQNKEIYVATKLITQKDTSINTSENPSFFNISQFSPDLISEFDKLIISDKVNISSIKPAAVKEKVASIHEIDLSWYKTIRLIQFIKFLNLHFSEELKPIHLQLTSIQMHDILDKILNSGTSKELFLRVERKSTFDTYLRKNTVYINHPQVEQNFNNIIDKRIFSLCVDILDVDQIFNLYLHPLFVWLNLEETDFEVDLISPITDLFITRMELLIQSILHHNSKIISSKSNQSFQDLQTNLALNSHDKAHRSIILNLLFSDKLAFNYLLFEKDQQVKELVLDQHLEAFIWFDFIKSDITNEFIDNTQILEVKHKDWQAKLGFNEWHNIIEFNCSCSKSNKFCSHLDVLLIYYNEGLNR